MYDIIPKELFNWNTTRNFEQGFRMGVVENFITQAKTAKTQNELKAHLENAVKELGFDINGYTLLNFGEDSQLRPHKILLMSKETRLSNHYIENKLELVNYVHKSSFKTGKILNWYQDDYVDKTDSHLLENEGFLNFQKDSYVSGYTSGVVIPIFGPSMEKALLVAGVYHGYIGSDSEEAQKLKLIAYHFHDRLKEISTDIKESPSIKLSSREQEVLQWVMAGKSDSVIGDIMNISDNTVNTYLRRCYHKLGVSNRLSAVVKAVNLNLISPVL